MPNFRSSSIKPGGAEAPEIRNPWSLPRPERLRLFIFGHQIDSMRRYTDEKGTSSFSQAIYEALSARQIMDDEFAADGKRHDHCAETEIVAQRT